MKFTEFIEKYGDRDIPEEELKETLGIEEGPKAWIPHFGDNYYYINTMCEIVCLKWDGGVFDMNHYAIGNCFKTKEEAVFALEKLIVNAELKRFAEEHNEGKIDWNDLFQEKYYIYYSTNTKEIKTRSLPTVKTNIVYFTSREIAKQAIEEIGEGRLKKYYFEVEKVEDNE